MKGFTEALAVVLQHEGGFSDHPADRGGATNQGVTQAVYDAFRKHRGLPPRTVRLITSDEVATIYREGYWVPGRCELLPWPASLNHFDAAVNLGVRQAAVLLQRAVGAKEDGILGPRTLEAVDDTKLGRLLSRMWLVRLEFYDRLVQMRTSQQVFLAGWKNRVAGLMERSIEELQSLR